MVLWIIVSSVLFHALHVSLITTERGDVRLVGGARRCTGVVEMKHQGVWRPVYHVWGSWTPQLLSVVCRQLGCGSDGSGQDRLGSTRQPVWRIYPSCKGSESAVVECRGRVVVISSSITHHLTCSGVMQATGHQGSAVTIWCPYQEGYGSAYQHYLCRGSCGDADVVIQSLIGVSGEIKQGRYSIRDDAVNRAFPVTISDLQLSHSGQYWCGVSRAGIDLYTEVQLKVTDGDVRLVGGASRCTGVVEMKHQGVWKPAISYEGDRYIWTPQLSSVVCRQLGCASDGSGEWRQGSTQQPVWWIHPDCNGRESAVVVCRGTVEGAISHSTVELTCSAIFSQCGRAEPPVVEKILGGVESASGTHPWQVSLKRRTKGSSVTFKHDCGGVLIASCWVLTAAHCIDSSMEMQVVLGGVDLKTTEESDQIIPVVRAIVHPDYRKSTDSNGWFKAVHNDVALLQLQATQGPLCAMETPFVKTACLPNQRFPDGKECVVSGWGLTREGGEGSNTLMEARVPLFSKQSCMAPLVHGDSLDDSMICAGYMDGGVNTCQGDSGGPLMCKQDGVHYITGVVSWGTACAARTKPGVYANVHKYVTWINQMMSNL